MRKKNSPAWKRNAGILAAMAACIMLAGCSSGSAKAEKDGSHEAEGMAECIVEEQNISYMVYLTVKTEEDGTILSVEDAGTEVPEGKDGLYKNAQALFEELKGKTAEMIGEVDVVSGATCSSRAILDAVGQALES